MKHIHTDHFNSLFYKEKTAISSGLQDLAGDNVQFPSIFVKCNLMIVAIYLYDLLHLKNKIPTYTKV